MSQNLQNFVKFQKFQLKNLVDFEKCCKTHIFLQNSEPIQPKTSNILPKICQKPATTLRVRRDERRSGTKGSRVAARPRRSVWVLTSWHLRSEDEAFTADAHISVTARKSVECILHICHSRKSVECIPAFMSKSSVSYVYTMNL